MGKKTCPDCGFENPEQNQFCQSCGRNLEGVVVQTQVPTDQQMPLRTSPPPPPTYTPQPPATQGYHQTGAQQHSSQFSQYGIMQINKLGSIKLKWSGLIDGASDKATDVLQAFSTNLQERQIPQVNIQSTDLTHGELIGGKRNFFIVQSHTGAILTVYIAPFGRDLYLTSALYIQRIYKWLYIGIMVGIAALLAIIPAYDRFGFQFTNWFFSFIGWTILIGLGAMVLGIFLRNSAKFLFTEEIDTFAQDDITATGLAVHSAMLKAIEDAGLDSSELPPYDLTHDRKMRRNSLN
jgi:hypothetical protein